MRPPLALMLVLVATLAQATPASATPAAPAPDSATPAPAVARADSLVIADLAWLAGCWRLARGGRVVDEQWMAPRGGTMLGMSRTVAGGRTVEFESMRLHVRDGRPVFTAWPMGRAGTSFPAVEVAPGRVVFEAPEHDFPQRIVYARGAGDSLRARIEGTLDGALRGFDFPMVRVPCPPADPAR